WDDGRVKKPVATFGEASLGGRSNLGTELMLREACLQLIMSEPRRCLSCPPRMLPKAREPKIWKRTSCGERQRLLVPRLHP
ncbi:hypothetical protein LINPERHAP2_LOCUS38271, partial [Linum perenne]